MFLRSLCGSTLPQSLHPPSNAEIASYWDTDTKSSREIAEEMRESENSSYSECAVLQQKIKDERKLRTEYTEWFETSCQETFDIERFEMEFIANEVRMSPLSVEELLSIAAADIDQGEENTDFSIEELRRFKLEQRNGSVSFLDNLKTTGLRRILPSCDVKQAQLSQHSRNTRFLSLLRRTNELQAQNVKKTEGLTYPQIQALPTFTIQSISSLLALESQAKKECLICREDFQLDQELRTLQCLHYFHKKCIDKWLHISRQCPSCNFSARITVPSIL